MLDYTNYYDDAVQGFPILVYAGEWDQRDGPSTQITWMKNMEQLKLAGD